MKCITFYSIQYSSFYSPPVQGYIRNGTKLIRFTFHHITKLSKQWNNNLIPFCYISSYFIPLTSHHWISKHGFNFFLFFHWNDTFQLKEEGIKPQKGKDGFDVWVPYGACFNSNEYPHRNTSNKLQRSFLNTLSTIDWNLLENMTSS